MLYESIERGAELKLSRHLPNCAVFDLFRDFFLTFYRLLKVKFSEQSSRQVATEEPKKRFLNRPGAVIYVIVM